MEKNFFKNGQEVVLEFYAPKNGQQYPFLGCLKRPHLEYCLSVRTEILCGILKEIVLGLDEKNSYKNGQEVVFQFYAKKNSQKCPFLGCLKWLHLENHLSVKDEILHGILKKLVLELDEKTFLQKWSGSWFSVLRPKTAKSTPFWAA
jgi:hypothetical protein